MESSLFLIPCYGHQAELSAILAALQDQHILVVDDGTPKPLSTDTPCIRHSKNRGYGAAQKTGFHYALANGFERVVLVHGDHQYCTSALQQAVQQYPNEEILLGSRMLMNAQAMPWWRKSGNRLLTSCVNQRYRSAYTDLHTGGRIYSRQFLKRLPYFSFSDDFIFDHQVLLWALQNQVQIKEFPMPSKYDETVSSISFWRAVRYGFGCLRGIYFPTNPKLDPRTPRD